MISIPSNFDALKWGSSATAGHVRSDTWDSTSSDSTQYPSNASATGTIILYSIVHSAVIILKSLNSAFHY